MLTDQDDYIPIRAGEVAYQREVGYNARCDYDQDGRLLGIHQYGPITPREWDAIHERYEHETTDYDYGFDRIPR